MSRLKLYFPDVALSEESEFSFSEPLQIEENRSCETVDSGPVTLPFRGMPKVPPGGDSMIDLLIRAQQVRDNRTCPDCHYPVVIPLELNDGCQNRSGMTIPGTATLVGFRCESCNLEWPC